MKTFKQIVFLGIAASVIGMASLTNFAEAGRHGGGHHRRHHGQHHGRHHGHRGWHRGHHGHHRYHGYPRHYRHYSHGVGQTSPYGYWRFSR